MGIERLAKAGVLLAVLGAGAVALAPGLARAARPGLLNALTVGIAYAKKGRLALESAWEDVEDLMAEAFAAAEARVASQEAVQAERGQEVDPRASAPTDNVRPFARRGAAKGPEDEGGAHGA